MSVRKRKFGPNKDREAWVVDYVDQAAKRHIKTFERQKDAAAYHDKVRVDISAGVHTAPSKSITVAAAAEDWLGYVGGEGRERSTIERYGELVRLYLIPRLGNEKLAKLTTPRINAFRDDVLEATSPKTGKKISRMTAKKVLVALKAILKDAKRRGNVAQNVAPDVSITQHGRTKTKLEIGRDIPTRDEIQRMIEAAAPALDVYGHLFPSHDDGTELAAAERALLAT